MFGEQMNNKKIEPVNLPKSAPIKEEIYVMPEKFHNQPVDNSNKVLFLVLIILVVALLGSGIYFAIDIMKKNSTKVIPVAINQPVKIEEPITETPKPVVPVNSPATTTEVVATSTSTVATSTIEVAPPVVSPSTPPILAMDSDVDNLTDIEEGIISADPNNPDTDGDTYKDGDELINGYNPLLAGSSDSAKLSSAVFMNGFTTNFVTDNFRVLYFHNWQVNAIAATKQLFITTNTGEIIKVSIKDNPTLLSSANWYLQNNPSVSLSQIKSVKNFAKTMDGIISSDGLTMVFSDLIGGKVYVTEYIRNADATFRYPALFQALAKSITPIVNSILPNQDSANSTSSATSTATSTPSL